MRFLIRADANFEIGSGHLMRCIAIGQMLVDGGHKVIFLTQTENKNLLNRIEMENIILKKMVKTSNISDDLKKTLEEAKKINIDWIITDGYEFETEYQMAIKREGFKLMCIDDIANCHYVSDIVLNQNLNAEKLFKYSCEKNTKLFLGSNYLLLRKEFWTQKNIKNKNKNCKRILVSFGNSNVINKDYFLEIIETLAKYPNFKKITVVSNPSYFEKINIDSKINVFDFNNNFIEIIKETDLGIIAMGLTSIELLWMGIPFVSTIMNTKQDIYRYVYEKKGIKFFLNIQQFKSIIDTLSENLNYLSYKENFARISNLLNLFKLTYLN